MKVYTVQEFDYDVSPIIAVFSTKEQAEQVAEASGAEVQEFELDSFIRPKDHKVYFVGLYEDGEVYGKSEIAFLSSFGCNKFYEANSTYHKKSLRIFYLWAKNEKHALELANQDRLNRLENGTWDK